MPSSVVIPVLAYANVREAADWLCRAFGFVERLRIGEHRAQLSFGSGSLIVAGQQEPLPEPGSGHSVMVRVTDVDSHCEHAEKTGARIYQSPYRLSLRGKTVQCREYRRPSLDLLADYRRCGPERLGRHTLRLDAGNICGVHGAPLQKEHENCEAVCRNLFCRCDVDSRCR